MADCGKQQKVTDPALEIDQILRHKTAIVLLDVVKGDKSRHPHFTGAGLDQNWITAAPSYFIYTCNAVQAQGDKRS